MAKRNPLLDTLTVNLTEEEIVEQRPEDWSLDTDSQLMQWYNSHPDDWILGGKARVYFWGAGGSGQLANDSKSTPLPQLCEFLECSQNVSNIPSYQFCCQAILVPAINDRSHSIGDS